MLAAASSGGSRAAGHGRGRRRCEWTLRRRPYPCHGQGGRAREQDLIIDLGDRSLQPGGRGEDHATSPRNPDGSPAWHNPADSADVLERWPGEGHGCHGPRDPRALPSGGSITSAWPNTCSATAEPALPRFRLHRFQDDLTAAAPPPGRLRFTTPARTRSRWMPDSPDLELAQSMDDFHFHLELTRLQLGDSRPHGARGPAGWLRSRGARRPPDHPRGAQQAADEHSIRAITLELVGYRSAWLRCGRRDAPAAGRKAWSLGDDPLPRTTIAYVLAHA